MPQAPSNPPAAPPSPPQAPWRQALFIAACLAVLWPWEYAPQAALLLGIVMALSGLTAFEAQSKKASRLLIQVCVVILGLRLDLTQMLHELRHGGLLAIATVFSTLAAGLLLGRALRTQREVSLLVSSGTAICGGSAIAAVGAAIQATSSTMAVATGAIFVLNAVGLFVLPAIGHAIGLTDDQFGTWAGIALHDIASVGGAGRAWQAAHDVSSAAVGDTTIQTAMIVKLTRVVWITPIAIFAQRFYSPPAEPGQVRKKPPFPWFIIAFIAASALVTVLPQIKTHVQPLMVAKDSGFQLALFLIGAGLSRKALASVGWRALVQAIVLWLFIASTSLVAVRALI